MRSALILCLSLSAAPLFAVASEDCTPAALTVRFNSHEPTAHYLDFSPYQLVIVGEPARRGNERTVIAEDSEGLRVTLAVWDASAGVDGFGRWITADSAEWEDVRAIAGACQQKIARGARSRQPH